MHLVLKRVCPTSILEKTAYEDLFDSTGTLLLRKGLPISECLRDRLLKREVYLLKNQGDMPPNHIKEFPKDTYIELVGSLWNIYHEAKLIGFEQIEKTVELVDSILFELRAYDIFFTTNTSSLSLEEFKQHDYGTFVHSVNVAILSALTGKHLGYREERLKEITLGALLHDLGKLQIPAEILNKTECLKEEEFTLIKQHPLLGEQMLANTRTSDNVVAAIKEHHERWNGSGYPYGIKENNIHVDAQIVAVTDVYEALTADRPYRKGLPPYHALEMIIAESGRNFNPDVVNAFRESLILYPKNSIITLNTGETCVVVAIPVQMPTRPLLRLLFDREGRYVNRAIYVDLMQDLTLFIERVRFNEAG